MIHTELVMKIDQYEMNAQQLCAVFQMLAKIATVDKLSAIKLAQQFFTCKILQAVDLIEGVVNTQDLYSDFILLNYQGKNVGMVKYSNEIATVQFHA